MSLQNLNNPWHKPHAEDPHDERLVLVKRRVTDSEFYEYITAYLSEGLRRFWYSPDGLPLETTGELPVAWRELDYGIIFGSEEFS